MLEEHPNGTVYVRSLTFGLRISLLVREDELSNRLNWVSLSAYWSPEIIKRQPQDFGVDMWAFGVLVGPCCLDS